MNLQDKSVFHELNEQMVNFFSFFFSFWTFLVLECNFNRMFLADWMAYIIIELDTTRMNILIQVTNIMKKVNKIMFVKYYIYAYVTVLCFLFLFFKWNMMNMYIYVPFFSRPKQCSVAQSLCRSVYSLGKTRINHLIRY